jgi:hypothetical protein
VGSSVVLLTVEEKNADFFSFLESVEVDFTVFVVNDFETEFIKNTVINLNNRGGFIVAAGVCADRCVAFVLVNDTARHQTESHYAGEEQTKGLA